MILASRFLCISDVRGDVAALAVALAAGDRYGCEQTLVAGDHCFPGAAPLASLQTLLRARATLARGMTDLAVATVDPRALSPGCSRERARVDALARAQAELGELMCARLARLPETVRLELVTADELVLVHGSPLDPATTLSPEMSDDELAAALGDDPCDVVVCGGAHVPFDRQVAGVRVINVGSVGDAPDGHAQASVVLVTSRGIEVEHLSLPVPRPS